VRRTAIAIAACAAVAVPLASSAQQTGNERRLIGRVISFQPYNLQLDRGPHVVLHRGTVIHPRGLTFQNGMRVRVYGHRQPDGTFSADQIDLLPARRRPL
jgi:hypothetical protein